MGLCSGTRWKRIFGTLSNCCNSMSANMFVGTCVSYVLPNHIACLFPQIDSALTYIQTSATQLHVSGMLWNFLDAVIIFILSTGLQGSLEGPINIAAPLYISRCLCSGRVLVGCRYFDRKMNIRGIDVTL